MPCRSMQLVRLGGIARSVKETSDSQRAKENRNKATKQSILGTLAKIYDPFGPISPVTLAGKTLYREVCDLTNSWDELLPGTLQVNWKCWEQSLLQNVQIPRSVTAHQEDIKAIDLYAFGDASQKGVSTVACAVVFQESGVNQALITSKSRLSKKDLSIPRLGLVSGHISANLPHNINPILKIPSRVASCTSEYRDFVSYLLYIFL